LATRKGTVAHNTFEVQTPHPWVEWVPPEGDTRLAEGADCRLDHLPS
jgi:hypothetical protein